ncbi:hypothetical protein KCU88_g227, partial [Aureobasidium melanogenum]
MAPAPSATVDNARPVSAEVELINRHSGPVCMAKYHAAVQSIESLARPRAAQLVPTTIQDDYGCYLS